MGSGRRRLGLLELAIAGLMVSLVAVVFAQVALRYLTYQPLAWTEEVARYLFVWVALLGAAAGGQRGAHFAVDLVARRARGPGGRGLRAGVHLLEAGLYGVLAWAGFQITGVAHLQRSASTDLPMSVPYLAVPLAAALLCGAALRRVRATWRETTPAEP